MQIDNQKSPASRQGGLINNQKSKYKKAPQFGALFFMVQRAKGIGQE